MSYRFCFSVLLLALSALATAATDGHAPAAAVECLRAQESPAIDGSLEDAAWGSASWQTCFRQSVPDYGTRASERTEAAFLFDDDNIYVAVRCFDSEPERIRATKLRHRDNPRRDDYVEVIFDTYQDQLRGSVFVVNPLGAKEEGQVNGFRHYNWDWNEVWEVAASITNEGWLAEFRIPLRVLRFDSRLDQVWGVNVRRTIQRKQEEVYLVPPPPPYDISSLNYAANLYGMEVSRRDRNLQLKPYVLAGSAYSDDNGGTTSQHDVGLDLKYSLTTDLTLDLTVNTDFAQVESDTEQVNLSRFSLFFPEKREFFLENAQLFDVGEFGRRRPEVLAFFSRRIGLYEEEESVPMDVGARVTGKIGRQDVGLLSVRTGAVDELGVDSRLYNVIRVRRNLEGRSYIGGIFTDSRRGEFRSSTLGIDCDWYLTENLSLSGFMLSVEEPGRDEGHLAWRGELDYTTDPFGFAIGHTEIGENFEPDIGYVRRSGYRSNSVSLRRSIRTGRWGVRRYSFWLSGSAHTAMSGPLESGRASGRMEVEFESGDRLFLSAESNFERLFEPFELSDDITFPTGDYDFASASVNFNTEMSRRWMLSANARAGRFYDGSRRELGGRFRYIFNNHLSAEVGLSDYRIATPHGDAEWQLWRARLTYTYNAYLSLSAFLQYNSSSGDATLNLRLRWIHSNDSDLFIVYNEVREHELDRWPLRNRDGIVKVNYRIFL